MNIPILEQLLGLASSGGFVIVDDLGGYVSAIVGLLLLIASLAAFLYFVLGGLKWITAGSDKGKVEEARTQITNAIIGLAIIAASWAVFLVLNHFFGLGLAGGSSTSSSTSGSSSGSGTVPPGYCRCGNDYCASAGTRGPIGTTNTSCYECQANGTWRPLYVSGNSGQPLTCSPITCQPCP